VEFSGVVKLSWYAWGSYCPLLLSWSFIWSVYPTTPKWTKVCMKTGPISQVGDKYNHTRSHPQMVFIFGRDLMTCVTVLMLLIMFSLNYVLEAKLARQWKWNTWEGGWGWVPQVLCSSIFLYISYPFPERCHKLHSASSWPSCCLPLAINCYHSLCLSHIETWGPWGGSVPLGLGHDTIQHMSLLFNPIQVLAKKW
jgi:hypothetical protein